MSQAAEPTVVAPEGMGPGERLLWQGRPRWQSLAVHAFHARKVALYFALLALWRLAEAVAGGAGAGALQEAGLTLVPGILAVGLLTGLAWASARAADYRITDRRVVLRVGVAVPMTVAVPLPIVDAAALREHRDGSGDIPLRLVAGQRASYVVLWPHVRPWCMTRPEPMLRDIPDPDLAASVLAAALAGRPVPAPAAAPAAQRPAACPAPTAAVVAGR